MWFAALYVYIQCLHTQADTSYQAPELLCHVSELSTLTAAVHSPAFGVQHGSAADVNQWLCLPFA